MAESREERKARLEAKERELSIKVKALKVRQKSSERKADARRKILVGSAVAAAVRAGVMSEEMFGRILDEFVTNEKDRVFLGLDDYEG